MSLSKRHHYIQVVLKTVDHLRYHQVTGLVILHGRKKRRTNVLIVYGNVNTDTQNNFKCLQPSLTYFQIGSVTAPPLPQYIVDLMEVSQGILSLLKRNMF